MINNLGFTRDNVKEETLRFYLSHGTTLAGLVADGHKVDYDKW
jgi:putative hydrolase of the HAD superfamily/pyrimidine and pyridine-specific 5'-nucleotidase